MSPSFDINAMRFSVRRGLIEWQRHALERMAERGIFRDEVTDVLLQGDMVENYPQDFPFPSGLFLGNAAGRQLHVVAAMNRSSGTVYVITAYEPDLITFEPDRKTRRKK